MNKTIIILVLLAMVFGCLGGEKDADYNTSPTTIMDASGPAITQTPAVSDEAIEKQVDAIDLGIVGEDDTVEIGQMI